MRYHTKLLRHFLIILLIPLSLTAYAGGGPKNVLLVINENSTESRSIGAYYQQKRGLSERNICRIHCSTAQLITAAECESEIIIPVRDYIESAGLKDRIDFIVLTKGMPLMASYNDAGWVGPVSVTSILTCLGAADISAPITNPYGPVAFPEAPDSYFSHQIKFGTRSYYAVTRLDAYTVEQVYRMIDDASARVNTGYFVLDGRYEQPGATQYYKANERLREANLNLMARGYPVYYNSIEFDTHATEFAAGASNVMGYFSWGSNESSYSLNAYTSHSFAPGSIADSYVSTSGRTFQYPPSYGQSLIADLIPRGLSGGNGYVSEPFLSLATYPNVLFDRYTRGYNLAESFHAATPRLFWKSVTFGDPLMAPFATPPSVTITNPTNGCLVSGQVTVSATATDASGVDKVEFYVNDVLLSTVYQPPYQFEWDTADYEDGLYTVEAVAYEKSQVYTQGMASISVRVGDTPLPVARIRDLSDIQEGSTVFMSARHVVAGTDAFTDSIYITEYDRSTGIRVTGAQDVPTGSLANITGVVTVENGERIIRSSYISVIDQLPISPLGMSNNYLANRGAHTGAEYAELLPGTSNTNLLVKTWGRVMERSDDSFVISDNSIDDSRSLAGGIRVLLRDLVSPFSAPNEGSFVSVIGVACYTSVNGLVMPAIRPRYSSDVSNGTTTILESPDDTLFSGWNLVAFPGIAVDSRAQNVLADLPATTEIGVWQNNGQSLLMQNGDEMDALPAITSATGFWLRLNTDCRISTEVFATEPDTDMWIGLGTTGYTIAGNPFSRPVDVQRCRVTDGTRSISIEDALSNGWIGCSLHGWNSRTSSMVTIDIDCIDTNPESYLMPWHSYWVRSLRPNLALIIPRPGES